MQNKQNDLRGMELVLIYKNINIYQVIVQVHLSSSCDRKRHSMSTVDHGSKLILPQKKQEIIAG